jgi:hypothetical protein
MSNTMTFSGEELVLLVISLVRATHPSMLQQEGDGFTVDFAVLDKKEVLDDTERLLFKIRVLMDSPSAEPARTVQLEPGERRALAAALAQLQQLQAWPADVVAMCKDLRARLTANT